MKYKTIAVEVRAPLAEIRLVRGAQGNPVDARLLAEVETACEAISGDGSVHAVLLTSGSDAFSRGSDGPSAVGEDALPLRCLELLPQPAIACIEGEALGAGLELALACDIRVAGAAATFAMPQVAEGAMPSLGGTQRLPRLVGPTVATSMLLLGEMLDAPAALACGLVSAVVPAGSAVAEGTRLGDIIASRGPLAMRYAKEAVLRGLDMPLDQALRYETDLTVILQTTADRAEGVAAFLDKRPPAFRGE